MRESSTLYVHYYTDTYLAALNASPHVDSYGARRAFRRLQAGRRRAYGSAALPWHPGPPVDDGRARHRDAGSQRPVAQRLLRRGCSGRHAGRRPGPEDRAEHAFDQLNMPGIMLITNVPLDDPRFEPCWQMANDRSKSPCSTRRPRTDLHCGVPARLRIRSPGGRQ